MFLNRNNIANPTRAGTIYCGIQEKIIFYFFVFHFFFFAHHLFKRPLCDNNIEDPNTNGCSEEDPIQRVGQIEATEISSVSR